MAEDKKKKSSLNMNELKAQLQTSLQPLARRHVSVAFVVVLGFLAYTVYTINDILSQPTDTVYQQEQQKNAISTQFDQDTIDDINQLKSRQENSSLSLPSGRISPFRE